MMASLNQRSSPSDFCSALISSMMFMARHPSRHATKQQGGVLLLVDQQTRTAPFDEVTFAGDQILDRAHAAARATRADLDIAEMEPEPARAGFGQRHGDRDRVVAGGRFLDEADHLAVVDMRKVQVAG